MQLSVVIPAFNEENNILQTIEEIENYLNSINKYDSWEVITVNDGSTDNTLLKLNHLKKTKSWLKVVDLGKNFGRGKAIRTGIENSSGEIIVSLDADLSYSPYHIDLMGDVLQEKQADIVLASAYGKGGTVKNVPMSRLWLSRVGNKILSYTFGGNLSVLTCSVRAYRKSFIDRIDSYSNDKDFHLEILHKAKILGATIIEVPANLEWREEKITKLSKPQKRRSTLRLRKTSYSHFFFAMLSKPGIIFFIPAYILFSISLTLFFFILRVILTNLNEGLSLYSAIRESMLSGTLTYITFAVATVLAIQFVSLGFLTNQNKRNYEEIYKTTNAILNQIKTKGGF